MYKGFVSEEALKRLTKPRVIEECLDFQAYANELKTERTKALNEVDRLTEELNEAKREFDLLKQRVDSVCHGASALLQTVSEVGPQAMELSNLQAFFLGSSYIDEGAAARREKLMAEIAEDPMGSLLFWVSGTLKGTISNV